MQRAQESEKNAETEVSIIFKNDAFARLLLGLAWPTAISTGGPERAIGEHLLPRPEFLAGLLAKGRQEAIELGADEAALDRLAADPILAESCSQIILSRMTNMQDLERWSGSTARRCYLGQGTAGRYGTRQRECIGDMARGIFFALVADRGASEASELSGALESLAKDAAGGQAARMALERIQIATETSERTPWGIFLSAVRDLPSAINEQRGYGAIGERHQAQAYLGEVDGWINARNLMARQALILATKAPAEGLAFQKRCAARMSLSFAEAGPRASLSDLLLEEEPEVRAASPGKNKKALKDLRKEGIAGEITLAAVEAFGLQADTVQGLVGEAKRALFEHCGLSPASWRAAVGSSEIAFLLVESLAVQARLGGAISKRENARAAKAAAKEKRLRMVAEQGSLWLKTKFRDVIARDAATQRSDMAVRVGNGASSKNLSKDSTQRLFSALSYIFFSSRDEGLGFRLDSLQDQRVSSFLLRLLSGRDPMPIMPHSDPAATRQTLREIESVERQSAQWVKIISEQIDKRVAKALAAVGERMDSERAPQFTDSKIAILIQEWKADQDKVKRHDSCGEPGGREEALKKMGLASQDIERMRAQPTPEISPWIAAHKGALAGFLEDVRLWVDFLRRSPHGYFATLPEDFGWGTIMRHQEQWHANEVARKMESDPSAGWEWPTPCGAIVAGHFSATPIASGRELIMEGKRMRHCVSSYADQCAKGHSHILSVAKHGVPFSTLELRAFDSRGREINALPEAPSVKPAIKIHAWKIVQNKGRHNAAIDDPEALAFAKHASERYAEAFEAIVNPKAPGDGGDPEKSIAQKARARRQASGARPAPRP